MRVVGIFSTAVGAAVVLVALVVGVLSAPDVKRYLNMRRM